jgi:hypothetical protein
MGGSKGIGGSEGKEGLEGMDSRYIFVLFCLPCRLTVFLSLRVDRFEGLGRCSF